MKIPQYIFGAIPSVSLTHGFTRNFGTVNISMTISIDRTKYLNGGSAIECLGVLLPNFKPDIQYYTREVN